MDAATARSKILDSLKGVIIGHGLRGGLQEQLNDPAKFQALFFPGIPAKVLAGYPKTIEELLKQPEYATALGETVAKAEKRAQSVLDAVKARGAKAGETMDATTERMLWPQVIQEAMIRELMSMVTRVSKEVSAKSNADVKLAEPAAVCALWQQLRKEDLASLAERGYFIRKRWCGGPWPDLITEDCSRFLASQGSGAARVAANRELSAWMDVGEGLHSAPDPELMGSKAVFQTESDYPALQDVYERLSGFPFEFNRVMKASLRQPQSGCCRACSASAGDGWPWRDDGADTACSLMYFAGFVAPEGGAEYDGEKCSLEALDGKGAAENGGGGGGGGGGSSGGGEQQRSRVSATWTVRDAKGAAVDIVLEPDMLVCVKGNVEHQLQVAANDSGDATDSLPRLQFICFHAKGSF